MSEQICERKFLSAGWTRLGAALALAVPLLFATASGQASQDSSTQAPDASAQAAHDRDEEWSVRLLQAKARVDQARHRLDEANAAYVRAIVGGNATSHGPGSATSETDSAALRAVEERERLQIELADAEKALPQVVAEARAAGASGQVLAPYRFTSAPSAPAH